MLDVQRSDLVGAVVGSGTMGRGIVQVLAQCGVRTLVFDAKPGAAQAAKESIAQALGKLAEKGRLQPAEVTATLGRIEILIPFNAPQGETTRILVDTEGRVDGAGVRTETLPESDQYTLQGEAFSRAVRGEATLPWGVDDAVQNLRIIEALLRSETSGRWETP